jgi:hypothetical protein
MSGISARVVTALHLASGHGTVPNDGALLVEVEVSRLAPDGLPVVGQAADPWGQRLRDPSIASDATSAFVGAYTTAGAAIRERGTISVAGVILGYRRDLPIVVDGEPIPWHLDAQVPERLQPLLRLENSPHAFWPGRYDDDDDD